MGGSDCSSLLMISAPFYTSSIIIRACILLSYHIFVSQFFALSILPTWAKLYISWEVFRTLNHPPSLKGPLGDSTEDASSSGDSIARPVSSQRDDETVGLKGIIKTQEYIKIITRALYSLGFKKIATLLEEESGIPLHSSSVTLFMQQVVDGKWDEGSGHIA